MRLEGSVKIVRYFIKVTGVVQGVGFRYHVLKIAERHHVQGHVSNADREVHIEAEGPESSVDMFMRSIKTSPPEGAKIRDIIVDVIPLKGDKGFKVKT
jgi:hydrogenase maturation protein HypF